MAWLLHPPAPRPFAQAPGRGLRPDAGRTTRLAADWPAPPPADGPLAPASDPAYPTLLPAAQAYHALLIRPAREPGRLPLWGRPDEWIGGAAPPGWAWVRPAEYPGVAGHIRVAALKLAVEHDLLAACAARGVWLAVRWAGYTQPTLYVDHGWLAARIARLAALAADPITRP